MAVSRGARPTPIPISAAATLDVALTPPGVGEQGPASRTPRREGGPQHRCCPFEPERALEPIRGKGRRSEHLGEEPLALTAEEIHLEEALRTLEIPLGIEGAAERGSMHHWNVSPREINPDRVMEPSRRDPALKGRLGRGQEKDDQTGGSEDRDQGRNDWAGKTHET